MILYIPYLIFLYLFRTIFIRNDVLCTRLFLRTLFFFLGGSYMHRCKDQQYYMNNQEVPMATQYTIIKAGSLFPDSPLLLLSLLSFHQVFFLQFHARMN